MNNRADSRLKMEQNLIILKKILLSRALKKCWNGNLLQNFQNLNSQLWDSKKIMVTKLRNLGTHLIATVTICFNYQINIQINAGFHILKYQVMAEWEIFDHEQIKKIKKFCKLEKFAMNEYFSLNRWRAHHENQTF